MSITDLVINTLLGRVTRHPAGMHCPARDDAFVSSYGRTLSERPCYILPMFFSYFFYARLSWPNG